MENKNYKRRGPRPTRDNAVNCGENTADDLQMLNLDSAADMEAVKARAQSRRERIEKHKKRNDRKKGGKWSLILLLICMAVFFFSAYQLYLLYTEYKAGSDEYKGIIDTAVQTIDIKTDDNIVSYDEYYVDFKALKAQNPDTVAWIRFDQPEQINYPIMQGGDNNFYLRKTFQKEYNIVGSIFMDTNNDPSFQDKNTVIYGHNMKDGSMFSDLHKYKDEDYCKANPYYYIYTPDGRAIKYQIVAIEIIEATDLPRYRFNFESDEVYQEYIDIMLQNSMYNTGASVSITDQITTLSTCAHDGKDRLIVQGVKMEEKQMVKPEE